MSEKRDVDVSGFRPSKHLGFNRHPLSSITFNEFEVVYNMVITLIIVTSDCWLSLGGEVALCTYLLDLDHCKKNIFL